MCTSRAASAGTSGFTGHAMLVGNFGAQGELDGAIQRLELLEAARQTEGSKHRAGGLEGVGRALDRRGIAASGSVPQRREQSGSAAQEYPDRVSERVDATEVLRELVEH